MSLALEMMKFAVRAHAGQVRKYTGAAYATHLAEVAGIVATVAHRHKGIDPDVVVAVAWGHDLIEDTKTCAFDIVHAFDKTVADGILALTDQEQGNRASRKAQAVVRLSLAPAWVQDVKAANIISNTPSIVQHDPAFAQVYVPEVAHMLDRLTDADPSLLALAWAAIDPHRLQPT